MPGAWEIPRPQVLMAVLTRESVSSAWANHFRNIQLPGGSTVAMYAGMPFDHARNNACKDALAGGYEWLFFLDDDVIVPSDTVHRLIRYKLPIVSGLYYRRHEGLQPVMQKLGTGWITNFQIGSMVEADLVGAGCLLIHRSVLEKVPKPWFDWRCDREDLPENQRLSEDFAFCLNAKNQQFQIFVDTSIQCRHLGFGQAEVGGKFSPAKLS